jgi:hypothetical protein
MAAVSFFLSFFSFSAQKERTHCKEKIKHSNQVRGIPNLSTPFYQAQVFYVDRYKFQRNQNFDLTFYASS